RRVLLHWKIDVRPEHQRLAPEAHGAIGIELLRLAERTLRLTVIERVRETQSLIEIGLCLLVGSADLVGDGPKAAPEWWLGIRERGRGAGCAHLGPRHFGLGETQHHIWRAAGSRCAADRSVGVGQ